MVYHLYSWLIEIPIILLRVHHINLLKSGEKTTCRFHGQYHRHLNCINIVIVTQYPIERTGASTTDTKVYEMSKDTVNLLFSKILATLNEFRVDDKYCDVSIDIGNESFKCHRVLLAAVSEYFNTIFSNASSKTEKVPTEEEQSVALRDIVPEALKKILLFVYTGHVHITGSDVLDILRTGDFLKLRIPMIEEKCIEYIRLMIRGSCKPVTNALDIFHYCCSRWNSALTKLLCEHICEHLDYFSKRDDFVEISFDKFHLLLKHRSTVKSDENVLLNSIILWAHHSFKERQHQVDELMEHVDFTRISRPKPPSPEPVPEVPVDDVPDDDALAALSIPVGPALHVYIRYSTVLRRVGVLSTRNGTDDWILVHEFDSLAEQMRNVSLDSHLYHLSYEFKLPKGIQIFNVGDSVGAEKTFDLKSPPMLLRKFDMCAMKEDIAVYDQELSAYSNTARVDDTFTTEEISRGFFTYKCRVDKWFPLTAMKQRLYRSCIAASGNLLYAIGGETFSGSRTSYAQCIDVRKKRWEKLPDTLKKYKVEACCVHKEKIYLAGIDRNSNILDVFDPVALKWRNVFKLDRTGVQLLSYENELWIVNRFNNNLNFLTYNDLTNARTIREITSLREAVVKVSEHAYCLDAVVI